MHKLEFKRLQNEIRRHGHEPVWTYRDSDYRLFVKVRKESSLNSFAEILPSSNLTFLLGIKAINRPGGCYAKG